MPRGVPRRNRIDLGTPPRLDSPFSFDAAECSAHSAPLLGINAIPFFHNRAPTTPHAPLGLRAAYCFVGALVHSIVNDEDVRCFDRPRTPCLAIHAFNQARLTTCGPCQHSLTPINPCQVRALVSCLAFCQHGLPRFTHSVTMITSRCLIVI
jgi:hypothetical protein